MTCDVIVVGAGPTGSCAAYELASSGLDVTIVDAETFPREKCCAGWLNVESCHAHAFIDRARKDAGAAPFRHMVFHAEDFSEKAAHSSRSHLGYVVDRATLDYHLLQEAEGAGAKIALGKKVTAVEPGEREVKVRLAGGKSITGRILLAADGVTSTLARLLGLREAWKPHQLVGCIARNVKLTKRQIDTHLGGGGEIHVTLAFRETPGYAWLFPAEGHASVGIGVRGATGPKRLRKLYTDWVRVVTEADLLPEGADTEGPCVGTVPAGAAIEFENHVGKRTVLVGDAGGFAAAASGEGIWPGIRSGMIACERIKAALAVDAAEGEGSAQDELLRFRTQWRSEMAPYLQMPNVNVQFLLPLIFTNQEICDRFARAFLFGENL